MEKFTKANAFAFLNNLAETISFATEDDKALFLSEVKDNFEPQAGGGASKNPSYLDEETGVMMHYCRFKQEFRPEPEMTMFNGKSKGATKLGQKHDYELKKQVDALKAEALKFFTAETPDYVAGAEKNMEADKLDASRSNPESFSDEILAQYIKEDDVAEATTNEADTAVDTNGEDN